VAVIAVTLIAGAIGWPIWSARQPAARFARGLEAFRIGDLRTLRIEGLALRKADGWQPQASLLTGMFEFKRGQLAETIEELEAARADERTRVRAWKISGQAFLRARQLNEARRAFDQTLEFDPDDVDTHRLQAATLYDLGAMALALPHLEEVKRLDPGDGRPYRFAGAIHKDYENFPEAIAEYRQALEHDLVPAAADEARFELAECLFLTGESDKALPLLAECRPSADVQALLGRCRFAIGEIDEAFRLAELALTENPEHHEGLKLKAAILTERADYAAAETLLVRAAAIDDADPALYVQLSQLYQLLGDSEKAEAAANKMQRISDLRIRLAELHASALTDTANADLRYQIGQTASELGMREIAAMWFQAALALDPAHSEARLALEEQSRQALPGRTQ